MADPNRERAAVLRSLGFNVVEFGTDPYEQCGRIERLGRLLRPTHWQFSTGAIKRFNAAFLDEVRKVRPDIIWTEKAVLLLPETIREARRSLLRSIFVSWMDDNPFGLRRREIPLWRYFLEAIPEYDLHFVKRKEDVEHFRKRGAQRVFLIHLGFFSFHRPVSPESVHANLRHDVLFVGSAIDRRARSIAYLIGKERLPVAVYGRRWNRYAAYYRHRRHFHGYLEGATYAAAVSGSKIALGYVSQSNLDEYTTRSVDIPACGGFLLAQRTPAHLEMFVEGTEAEFFGSDAECADKIRYYLTHDDERQRIARAGHERALRSDYSLNRYVREAAREMLSVYEAAGSQASA